MNPLNKTGRRIIQIQRMSNKTPRKKDEITVLKLSPSGLKAKYVDSLNNVKITRKIRNSLTIHCIVLGTLHCSSMLKIFSFYCSTKETLLFHSMRQSYFCTFFLGSPQTLRACCF